MPGRYIFNLLKIFIYYMLLFAACRLVFLVYFFREVGIDSPMVFLYSLWGAHALDVSTACYLLFIPLLILLVHAFYSRRPNVVLLRAYLLLTSLVFISLAIAEIGIYREIHVKLYYNLLLHLKNPEEVVHSTSYTLITTVILLVLAVFVAAHLVIKKWVVPRNISMPQKISLRSSAMLIAIFMGGGALLVIGCRGGLQPIPINEGEVYFSKNQAVNDATVNPLWNIVHSYIENKMVLSGDAYKVMPDEEAQQLVHHLFNSYGSDSVTYILKSKRPNICFLILESWSADVIASAGGYKGLTPNFEKLVSEGYFFTNIKPTGHISDQGVTGILSGYPALPIGSAINQPEGQFNIPCIVNELNNAGYRSSFYFGGQLIYGNIKSYLYRNKFNNVIEQDDLPASLPAGRLGIHDSIMLPIWFDSLQSAKEPFFSCLFTLSTHSPFDEPTYTVVDTGGFDQPYLNSIAYTDRQLGSFFERVKHTLWYENTLFVLVADHSHGTPHNYSYDSPEMYHIPLLFWGGALKDEYRGYKNNLLGSQTDIPLTLLHQLRLETGGYKWSKDILNNGAPQFAFYTFNEGFGYVDAGRAVVWNKKFPGGNRNDGKTPEEKGMLYKRGAAILQTLMKDFLKR